MGIHRQKEIKMEVGEEVLKPQAITGLRDFAIINGILFSTNRYKFNLVSGVTSPQE